MRVEIHLNFTGTINLNSNRPKIQACFLGKKSILHHWQKKIKWLLCICHAFFACHIIFLCSFEKPLAVKHKSGITKGMYCRHRRIKKRRRTEIQLKNLCFWLQMSAVLICSRSPQACFFSIDINVHIAETGNKQHGRIIISDGILLMKLIVLLTIGDFQS